MLSSDNLKALAAAICATAETLGQTMSAGAAKLMAEDLAEYPAPDIRGALQACRRELTGKLTLAAILQRVQAADGRPGDDEAWAIALQASDESETVVLTAEILFALAAARPVLAAGDKIGARMAFKGAYVRAVDESRRNARPATWTPSLGSDPQRRVAAIEEAGRQGRLPAPRVREYLSQFALTATTSDGAAIAGLLTDNGVAPSATLREKWQQVKASLQAFKVERALVRQAEIEAHQEDFDRRKSAQLAAVAVKLSGGAV